MKIKLTNIHVDDQEKALRFYTEVLGFVKKTDVSAGRVPLADGGLARGARRRRAAAGAQRQPGREDLPAGTVRAEIPAAMFFTDDVQADYERIKARGANFTMPPTEVDGLDHRHAERHLRQPDPADAADLAQA